MTAIAADRTGTVLQPDEPMAMNPSRRKTIRAWSVLAILICFYQLSFLDKQMYSLLIKLIGDGLDLSDTDLGLIQGVGFSSFYTLGVLATGWAVDSFSRRSILFWGVLLWSLAAAACGLASGFGSLFAARSGVGLGEAVVIPTALSLIAMYFPRDRLSFATGIFIAGANIGGVIAVLVGGSLIARFVEAGPVTWPIVGTLAPWQAAFVVTGLPGVLLAFLAFGIPRESADRRSAAQADANEHPDDLGLWPFIKSRAVFLIGVLLATALLTMCAYALIVWSPAYFERAFGWGHARIGVVIATGIAAGGLGNIMWGWVADRIRRTGRRDGLFLLYSLITLIGLPIAGVTFLSGNPTIAAIGYPFVWLVLNSFGPMLSAIQFGIPDRFRGRMVGLKTTFSGLIGLSSGPILVSLLTDKFFHDKAMVGYSIFITLVVAGLSAVLVMLATRRAYIAAVIAQEQDDAARAA